MLFLHSKYDKKDLHETTVNIQS